MRSLGLFFRSFPASHSSLRYEQLGVFACPCTWICLLLASLVSIKAEALALEEALREGLPEVDRWA